MATYAGRLAEQINATEPYCLLGVSFGGMLAVEMARLMKPSLTIIVSSVRQGCELPWYARLIGSLGFHHLALPSLMFPLAPLVYPMLGAVSDADRALIRSLLKDTDHRLFRWSMDRAIRWRFTGETPGLIHIHGTADRILPAEYVNPDYLVKGGTHLMIYNRASEISTLIDTQLALFQN